MKKNYQTTILIFIHIIQFLLELMDHQFYPKKIKYEKKKKYVVNVEIRNITSHPLKLYCRCRHPQCIF